MLKRIGLLLFLLCLGGGVVVLYFLYTTVDIRPDYVKHGLQQSDYEKGKLLITAMENAYGGYEQWMSYEKAVFIQVADWYGRKSISGWDVVPQRFELAAEMGKDYGALLLVDGPNTGTRWGIDENGGTYTIPRNQAKEMVDFNRYHDKYLFKNYWFQFPFRIREADFVAYAGEENIQGKTYDLVYATWGSEEANDTYDQYVLYLNQENHHLEWLYFTVRDKAAGAQLSAKFDDFKYVDKMILPHAQYIRYGKPGEEGAKLHENHYEIIRLGSSKISR